MSSRAAMVLEAGSPAEWLERHLGAKYERDRHGAEAGPGAGAPERWFTRADLVADDARVLRATFAGLVADDLPAPAAATFVASYVGGLLADAVGYCLAGMEAGLVVAATGVRWRRHPDGWFDRIDLAGTRFVVAADHPWADRDDVDVVADDRRRLVVTVESLVDAVAPIIDACNGLAKVGRAGLWNEVGDGLGMALVDQEALPVREEIVALLCDAVHAPGARWKARPTLRIAEASFGPTVVGQKGGCCLAYTRQRADVEETPADESDLDRAYRQRFPDVPGEPRYCTTCSLRDPADCEARQIFWMELQRATTRAETAGAPTSQALGRPVEA